MKSIWFSKSGKNFKMKIAILKKKKYLNGTEYTVYEAICVYISLKTLSLVSRICTTSTTEFQKYHENKNFARAAMP